jgi:hypothetical protein
MFYLKRAHVLNRMNVRFKLNVRTFKNRFGILEKKQFFYCINCTKKQFFYLDL